MAKLFSKVDVENFSAKISNWQHSRYCGKILTILFSMLHSQHQYRKFDLFYLWDICDNTKLANIYPHLRILLTMKLWYLQGGSPGLVVMGGDSCSKGREFESGHRILNGPFLHLFVVKIVMCVWKDENEWKKRPGLAHFFNFCSNMGGCYSSLDSSPLTNLRPCVWIPSSQHLCFI